MLCLISRGYAQDHDLKVSGNFQDIPFSEFVSTLEIQSGVSFYYFDTWVAGVKITASGTNLSLNKILSGALLPVGVHHYLDEFGNVYLTYDNKLIPQLPDQNGSREGRSTDTEVIGGETLTSAEQRYIEGHKSGLLETLVVGNERSGTGQAEVFVYGKIIDSETGEPLIGKLMNTQN